MEKMVPREDRYRLEREGRRNIVYESEISHDFSPFSVIYYL